MSPNYGVAAPISHRVARMIACPNSRRLQCPGILIMGKRTKWICAGRRCAPFAGSAEEATRGNIRSGVVKKVAVHGQYPRVASLGEALLCTIPAGDVYNMKTHTLRGLIPRRSPFDMIHYQHLKRRL